MKGGVKIKMKCIFCEGELKKIGNEKAVCKDCISYIVNKAKEEGADFESYADAIAVINCPSLIVFK